MVLHNNVFYLAFSNDLPALKTILNSPYEENNGVLLIDGNKLSKPHDKVLIVSSNGPPPPPPPPRGRILLATLGPVPSDDNVESFIETMVEAIRDGVRLLFTNITDTPPTEQVQPVQEQTLPPSQQQPSDQDVDYTTKIISTIIQNFLKQKKGGKKRSSSTIRKSCSSRRGRRSSKKRGTQRKQKRRQRRTSRRAY